MNSGAVWNLTANTYVSSLVNNGTINKNGYTLTATTSSGCGTINETSGISKVEGETDNTAVYTRSGRRAGSAVKGIKIKNGKKFVR